mgnify:FL=1
MLDRWKGMQLTSDQEALVNEMLSDLDKCDQGLVNKWRAEGHSDYWIAMMLRDFGQYQKPQSLQRNIMEIF